MTTQQIAARYAGSRFLLFSAIGGFVFILGFGLQAGLTSGLHVTPVASYLAQAAVSVQASFALNRWLTWRDRDTPLVLAFARFNAQKALTVALNLALYSGLLWLGMNYLVANVVLTALFTVVNFVGADRFVFVPAGSRAVSAPPGPPILTEQTSCPLVSVVIPCRGNELTIGSAVRSLLAQDYQGLAQIILVGSPGDTTWDGLAGIADRRLVTLEIETPPGLRDANFKRDAGIRSATGDLISLVDSDMVLPADWMSRAVSALASSGASCVTGGMRSLHDTYWGRFTDGTRLGAKTPRITASYLVTKANFGGGARKPPITANILFTPEMYARCPIDVSWSHGSYEDYEWFWRVACAGYSVLVSVDLFGWHHHRRGIRPLIKEYRRSSRGCAYFIRVHKDCPLSRRRLTQAVGLPVSAIAALAGAGAAIAGGYGGPLGFLALAAAAGIATDQLARSRRLESLTYPVTGFALGLAFTTGLITHLIKSSRRRPSGSATRLRAATVTGLFVVVLAAGTALRLWKLGTSPAWQWDEAVYWRVAVNVQHGTLAEHPLIGVAWVPFLYQPPFYSLLLAGWFDLTGATIFHARVLGVIATALVFAAVLRLLWKIHGPKAGLFAIIPVMFDGWLIYIQRVSYIENVLLLLIVIALLAYQRALEKPSWRRFALAGAALAGAAIFKQTGAYDIVAVLFCWLIGRRAHKGHFVLVGVAIAVIVAYIVAMHRMYDLPGRPWFTEQSLVQIRRVLGLRASGGSLGSASALLHLLAAQYRYFVPSVLVGLSALVVAGRRLLQCYRARSWRPAQPNALLFSWMAAGVVVFGFSSLKFPQYFALVLIPAYCYLWTEVARWDWRRAWKTAVPATAVVASVGCFAFAVPGYDYNTLRLTQRYVEAHIPAGAVVVTEENIGDLIDQPWCTVEFAQPCLNAASYAITWRTYLESSFTQGHAAFFELMKGAVKVKSFSGPAGTATIWKLEGT